jgi:hypothetical protein
MASSEVSSMLTDVTCTPPLTSPSGSSRLLHTVQQGSLPHHLRSGPYSDPQPNTYSVVSTRIARSNRLAATFSNASL